MGSIFKAPSIPAPPPIVEPVEEVPSEDDVLREQREKEKLDLLETKRKGRRSTILTGTGLSNEDLEVNKKTLLGG